MLTESGPSPAYSAQELLHRGTGKTAMPATRVTLATHGAPPLGISWSVGNKNLSGSVASTHSVFSLEATILSCC